MKSYWYIRVKKLAIALASKDNKMAKSRIYLRRNSEYYLLGSDVYERHYIYIFLIYYQVVYICYFSLCFVAWHHIYFIFAHDLVRIFPIFVLGYSRVKHIKFNRTFPVSSLSFFLSILSCNYRFELHIGIFRYF
jgi:hypothetical protein